MQPRAPRRLKEERKNAKPMDGPPHRHFRVALIRSKVLVPFFHSLSLRLASDHVGGVVLRRGLRGMLGGRRRSSRGADRQKMRSACLLAKLLTNRYSSRDPSDGCLWDLPSCCADTDLLRSILGSMPTRHMAARRPFCSQRKWRELSLIHI